MKKKERKLEAENLAEASTGRESAGQEPTDTLAGKKKMLMEKCDSLSEAVLDHKNTYLQILSSRADANSKIVEDVQRQIRALKEGISGPGSKKIKKAKLADALTDLSKYGKKVKLKPELGRKKDLNKIDDFLLYTFGVLDTLNDKFLSEQESSEHPQV